MLLSWFQLLLLLALWAVAFGLARRFDRGRALHLDVLALGVLALACLGFYWQIFFNSAWMPPGGGDLASFLWPTYHFAARSLKAGVLPLWNPHLYGGAPFAADNQSGLFYPIYWLAFVLSPSLGYESLELLSVFHVWWAGVGAYVVLRAMVQPGMCPRYPLAHRLPALAGALAFMFSDLFITHFGNTNLIAVAAWLPWVFAAFRQALLSRRATGRYTLAAGAMWGLAALAGHMQITLLIGLWLGGYAAYRALAERSARALAWAALCGGVMFGCAALMLLPAYEMARHTGRAALAYDEAARFSLPPAGLLGLIIPALFGRGAGAFPPWERVEFGYIGILPLALAGLALASRPLTGLSAARRSAGQPDDRPFLALASGLAMLLALGGYSVLHGWVYRFVPGFNQLRASARAIVLFDFGVALLTGLGLQAWQAGLSRRARRALHSAAGGLAWLGMGLAAFGLPMLYFMVTMARGDAGLLNRNVQVFNGLVLALGLIAASAALISARANRWLSPVAASLLAISLIGLDLFSLGASVDIEPNDPTSGFDHPEIVAFLKEQGDLFRIEAASGWWQPDAALLYGLYDIKGIYNPLGLALYQTYTGGMGNRGSPLYNALNVKYVLADKGDPPGDARFVPVMNADPHMDVYLNTAALPRAWLVGCSQPVSDGAQAWEVIHAPDFDPAVTVAVEGGLALDGALAPPATHLEFVGYNANEVRLLATTPGPAYLVLSELYYPGWRAWVDGQPTPVRIADFALRAVYLEPGAHQVRLTFQPWSWTLGLTISLLTWLVVGGVWGLARLRPGATDGPFTPGLILAAAARWFRRRGAGVG